MLRLTRASAAVTALLFGAAFAIEEAPLLGKPGKLPSWAKDAGLVAGGLVEGFISDTPDLKTCIKTLVGDMKNLTHDAEAAVNDFEKKSVKGVLEGLATLASAFEGFPTLFETCKATAVDVAHIVEALKAFRSPKSVVVHLGKDLWVNRKDIYKEIKTAVADYKSKSFEDFGVQIGMALRKVIVGFEVSAVAADPKVKEAELISGGLVEGFISDKPDVKTCVQKLSGFEKVAEDVEAAVKDFEKKTAVGAAEGLVTLAKSFKDFPTNLESCNASAVDVEHIVEALKAFHSPKEFAYHVGKDLWINRKDIYQEIKTAVADYKSKSFEDFGVQVGMALRMVIVGTSAEVAGELLSIQDASIVV